MTDLDPRLGRIANDAVEWPTLTANGFDYDPPAYTTRQLGGGYFVVIDQHRPVSDATIDALKALIPPSNPTPVKIMEKPSGLEKTG